MGIVVEVSSIRPAWMKARSELRDSLRTKSPNSFWKTLGDENGMTVIVAGHIAGFPVIDVVEFNDEQSYAWFMLKWSR